MVVLLSIPGMGKTEVGIRVSHLLKQQRVDQFVTHIRVESHHQKLVDICSEILDRLSSRTWSSTTDFRSLAKRKLSGRKNPTVIVLDNTENIQGEEFDEFAKWLVKSAPNVKLIITTRKVLDSFRQTCLRFLSNLWISNRLLHCFGVLLMTVARNTPRNLRNYVVEYRSFL